MLFCGGFELTETSFEALRKIQLLEKNYASLSELGDDFFEKYRVLLLEMRERLRKDFSIEAASSFDGMQRLLSDVMRRREQKLFLKALRDFRTGAVDSKGLALEEKQVYAEVIRLLKSYEEKQTIQFNVSHPRADAKPSSVEVTFLVDLPAFVGASGSLGPFSTNQKASLPPDDARLLIEQGVAREA